MGKDITESELLDELCKWASGDLIEIQPGEISFSEVSKTTGMKIETLYRRTERGEIPEGYEVVDRRGKNGQIMKCYKKL